MKLSVVLLLIRASGGGVWAFVPHQTATSSSWNHVTTRRNMSSSPPTDDGSGAAKKVLTAADVVAKAKAQGSLPGEDGAEEYPKLFTREIYDDFQSALLKLERRVKEGPGSLSKEEIDTFQEEADRIVEEMKMFLKNPEERKKEISKTYVFDTIENKADSPPEEPKVVASIPTNLPPPQAGTDPVAPVVPTAPANASTPPVSGYGITDSSLDEGPAFDGKGGFGLARGTSNTYVIPGMDEMSPEEYRDKLQESISARQAKRREDSLKSRGGIIGNASSQGYLDSLSKKGETTMTSTIGLSMSTSSSSSVQKSYAVNEDLMNEHRVADNIIVKTEAEVRSERGNYEEIEKDDSEKDDSEKDGVLLSVEEQGRKEGKPKILQPILQPFSRENESMLRSVVTKFEKSKSEKDLIRMSEWQALTLNSSSDNSEDLKTVAGERYSLGQSSGYFIKNDDGRRQNPILGMDPSKKYVKVLDRTGSTTQRPVNTELSQSVFDKNSVGAIRKSPPKSQLIAHSLAKDEMDQRQRPTPGSESPNYQTVSGRTTVGDFRKNKPLSSPPSTVSLVESENRLRPTPGTDLPEYHKLEDWRSVGDMRKSSSKLPSSMSSLVGLEKRQRPTPRTQSSTQSAADVKTFVGDLRNTSNKPLAASSARTSLVQTEKRTRPVPSSELPSHAQVRDRRSVGDFRDPATKNSHSSTAPASLIENEGRQRPIATTSLKEKGVSDSRGVIFKTSSSGSLVNTAASLIADEDLQRPVAAKHSNDLTINDSRGVVFKSTRSKSEPQAFSSLIADEGLQRPVVNTSSKDVNIRDSRGVVFKSTRSKSEPQAFSSLIADEVRERPTSSNSLRKFALIHDRTGDARVEAKKPFPQPPAPRTLFDNKQTRPPRASTDPRKYAQVQNRTGPDVRRDAKEKTASAEEESHWWNEKTQRPRTVPPKKPEALERDTQTQSSQVRKSHIFEEKLRREQEFSQAPIAALQPSSLKALVKEERHEEEEKHNKTPLKLLLKSDRPIAGVKEVPQKPVSKESELNSLLKDDKRNQLSERRQLPPPNAGEEWWNEKNERPDGYVKHSQPINTSYENRANHLRDYGDVVNQPGSDSTDHENVHDEDIQ